MMTLLLRHGNFLPSYILEIAYSGRKTQEEALVLLGAQTSKQPVISVEVRALLHVRALDVIDLPILRVRASAINIPRRHIRVSLVPRPFFRFNFGSGW